MPERETLQEIGSFGLSVEVDFAIVEQDLGDGYDQSILMGSSAGLRAWNLVYKTLPQTLDGAIMRGTELESRADYVWDFFVRMKAAGNASFELICPKDGKRYLVKFAEHKISYELFMVRLFSSGVRIVQRRDVGVSELPDGSLGSTENPDGI
jgi:hypothetical protein